MAGILVALEFILRKTDDTSLLVHKYENPDKLLSDPQSLYVGSHHCHVHKIKPQLHIYHG